MTSNIGSEYILNVENAAERTRLVNDALRNHFRPEFLNRIDETIIFDRLSEGDLREIVKLQIARVVERISKRDITLEVTDRALEFLSKEGYDPAYGARPLKRVIQKLVLDPLSLKILEGQFLEGSKITVDFDGKIFYK